MRIGYARVSTEDQSLEVQVAALEEAGCEKIFQEKISGTKKNRPELSRMLDILRTGDKVLVWKLDRLGRSTKDLIEMVTKWQEAGIAFQSITDGLTFDDTAFGKMIFTVMAAFSQLERDLISERTKAALAIARKKGRIGGRKRGLSKEAKKTALAAAQLYQQDEFSVTDICNQLSIARSTFYKYLRWAGVEINSSRNLGRPPKKQKNKSN